MQESTEVQRKFLREPLSDSELVPGVVPGCGEKGVAKLAKAGVRSPQQLMGFFMLFNRDEELFADWLAERDILPKFASIVAEALAGKSANFCTDDPPPTTPVRGADGKTTTVAESFARSPLSTAKLVKGLVPGLGVVGVGRLSKKIKDRIPRPQIANTPSAVQLLGLFLALGRSEAGLKEFLTEDCECKPSDADRTVAALQAKAESICGMQAGVATPAAKRTAPRLAPTPEAGEAGEAEADDAGGAALDEAAVEKEVRSTRSVLGVLLLLGLLGAAAAVLARVGGYA